MVYLQDYDLEGSDAKHIPDLSHHLPSFYSELCWFPAPSQHLLIDSGASSTIQARVCSTRLSLAELGSSLIEHHLAD